MRLLMSDPQRIFASFLIFGLVNNIIYVVILSAAIDLVGGATPKAVVLLADIVPALLIKLASPLFIHLIGYDRRILTIVGLSCFGMIIISLSGEGAVGVKVMGIAMASLSSGIGEVSFLQLTHYYPEKNSIGGFSMGTGAAGILGSFCFLLLTSIIGISTRVSLLIFAIIPFVFPIAFYFLLPKPSNHGLYELLPSEEEEEGNLTQNGDFEEYQISHELSLRTLSLHSFESHIHNTFSRIKPLIVPYMIPLCSVYIAEYTINQGISPTLLIPLDKAPHWLISSHRDTYVVYGFVYQLGVFVSRSSATFNVRFRHLYTLSGLQALNVGIAILQSMHLKPHIELWLLLLFSFYEGLLGGLLYVNTFLSVSEQVPKAHREFSMGCVGISDSLGIMIAGCISMWLENKLCQFQVDRGQKWCRTPSTST